jgi:undecaprenyl diphosphate synthase
VALVCDGNSRWAARRGLPAAAGHAAGADRLVDVLTALQRAGVSHCTMYGFSTENWKRPRSEIRDLFRVMEEAARKFYDRAVRQDNLRLRVIGDLADDRIPGSLREIFERLVRETNERADRTEKEGEIDTVTLSLAINYGGRQDIVQASKRLAVSIAEGSLDADDDVTEDTLASFLSTADLPDPDLIIRTSGETRLSNFLLWNAAYTELYFTETLWPDFDETCLQQALEWYRQRQRNFGGRVQEVIATNGASQPR